MIFIYECEFVFFLKMHKPHARIPFNNEFILTFNPNICLTLRIMNFP